MGADATQFDVDVSEMSQVRNVAKQVKTFKIKHIKNS
jgi:hypothetical protein